MLYYFTIVFPFHICEGRCCYNKSKGAVSMSLLKLWEAFGCGCFLQATEAGWTVT